MIFVFDFYCDFKEGVRKKSVICPREENDLVERALATLDVTQWPLNENKEKLCEQRRSKQYGLIM